MKKIVIPAILAGIVLVAGIFALMPVEKATTVHTTIQTTTGTEVTKVKDGVSLDPADGATASTTVFATTADTTWRGHLAISATTLGAGDAANTLTVNCETSPGVSTAAAFTASPIELDFACASLIIDITDNVGVADAAASVVDAIAQAHVSKTVLTETT